MGDVGCCVLVKLPQWLLHGCCQKTFGVLKIVILTNKLKHLEISILILMTVLSKTHVPITQKKEYILLNIISNCYQ